MELREIKLITLGNSKVGKSSFILRYTDNEFSIQIPTTIGIDYKYKFETLDSGERVKIYIFDTNGQERFRAISKNMIKNANGVLLLYDITDRESFTSVAEWMQSIYNEKDKNFPIVLIGNKIDREDDRVITKNEGEAEAKRYNIDYFEISCKNNINIRDPIMNLISKISEANDTKGVQLKPLGKQKNKKKCCK